MLEGKQKEGVESWIHELRGPLAIVQAHADLLVDGLLGELTSEQEASASTILDGVQRMDCLIVGLRAALQEKSTARGERQ